MLCETTIVYTRYILLSVHFVVCFLVAFTPLLWSLQRLYRRWGMVRSPSFGPPLTTDATQKSWQSWWRAAGPRTPQRGLTLAISRYMWPNLTSETCTLFLFTTALVNYFFPLKIQARLWWNKNTSRRSTHPHPLIKLAFSTRPFSLMKQR